MKTFVQNLSGYIRHCREDIQMAIKKKKIADRTFKYQVTIV